MQPITTCHVHRPVYTAIATARADGDAFRSVIDGWRRWAIGRANARAEQFVRQTGEPYVPDTIPEEDGECCPVDGWTLTKSTWVSDTDMAVRSADLTSREFQAQDRFWRTTLQVASMDGEATVIVRMGPETPANLIRPHRYEVAAPGLWRELSQAVRLFPYGVRESYGHVLSLGEAKEFLSGGKSRLPLVVISRKGATGEFTLGPQGATLLSEQLFGIARVAALANAEEAWELSRLVGDSHGCYNGAVRVYWPGFSRERAPDYRWLFVPDRYLDLGEQNPAGAFARMLLRRLSLIASSIYSEPDVVRAVAHRKQQEEREELRSRLQMAVKAQEADAATELLDETIKELNERHAAELQQLKDLHEQQVKAAYGQWGTEEEDSPDQDADGLVLEFFQTSGRRRPVLDFADDELQNRDTRRRYLDALQSLPTRLRNRSQDFTKVRGAAVADAKGTSHDLWEYRAVQRQGQWVRVFFAMPEPGVAVLLHAMSKRQNSLSPIDYQPAKERLGEWLQAQRR